MDYARGVAVERRDEVATIIADDVRVWAAGVELVMEELSGGDLLPGRIFLCGGGSRLPEIRAALESEAFYEAAAVRPAARGHRHGPRPDRVHRRLRPTCWSTSRTSRRWASPSRRSSCRRSEDPLDAALRRVLRAMKV